jgi:hypothetical protein
MERYLEVVEDRLRSALEQMRGSSAGEHYRTLLAALRQFVAKLANSRYGTATWHSYFLAVLGIRDILVRIRIRTSDKWIWTRIWEAQKHADPQHCFLGRYRTVPYDTYGTYTIFRPL